MITVSNHAMISENLRISIINKRLKEIEKEKMVLIEEKKQLTASITVNVNHKLTPKEKVALFRLLFKGRIDVYAKRWENKQQRSGYSPACDNEWVRGLCNKPKIKCGDCHAQRFKAITEQVIYDHLSGKHVMGVYPLLPDNTCYFLAMDFDKDDWQEATQAVMQVCMNNNIQCAVEISRSSQGAHLWMFFSEPIHASKARQLGFLLLDCAMEQYSHLSFDSYDRLFPNQNEIPEGGFGNLIALPLQYQARLSGGSVFVNEAFEAYKNQWYFLSQIQKHSEQSIDKIIQSLEGNVDKLKPWEKSVKPTHVNLPKKVILTLANHIYIEVFDLPV